MHYPTLAEWESEKIKHKVAKLKPYRNICDITVLNNLQRFYSLIYSRHKNNALNLYWRKGLFNWIENLPNWVSKYADDE